MRKQIRDKNDCKKKTSVAGKQVSPMRISKGGDERGSKNMSGYNQDDPLQPSRFL